MQFAKMITEKEAIKKVQEYLDIRNQRPNIHIYEIPVYTNPIKKLRLSMLKWYLKIFKGIPLDYPEDEIRPDGWRKSKAIEVIWNEFIKDHKVCWSIPYCTLDFYKTQDFRYGSIGGGPIFVDKENGKMYQTGSAGIDWLESFKNFKNGTNHEDWPKWESIKT